MSVFSRPTRSRPAVPPTAQRVGPGRKTKLRFLFAPNAMLASAALHAIAALFALLLMPGATMKGVEMRFILDAVREEQTELQVFSSVLVEPPLGATASLLDEGVSDTLLIGIPEGVMTTNAFGASLLRSSSEDQTDSSTVSEDCGNELNKLRMTFVMDASHFDEKIAWVDTAHTDVDGPRRVLSSAAAAVQRGDHFTVIANDIMALNPGHIPSLAFIPLGAPNEMRRHANEMSAMRRDILEWAVSKVLATPRGYTVRPSMQVIIIAHDAPLPLDKLRRIVVRWADQVPMLAVCVKFQRSHGDLFQRMVADSGGAYFGIQ